MGKFDNVRKTIRKNKRKIHIIYFISFILFILITILYIQNYKLKTEYKLNLIEKYYNDNSKSILELKELNSKYNEYLDSLPFGKPVDSIIVLSEFGWRTDPFTKNRKFHYGIDLKTKYNQPILATGNGKIIKSGWSNGFGNCIKIEHSLGYVSLYGHLNKLIVKKGDNVLKGDTIGLAGSTGRATGVHLHYEIHLNDKRIDPYKYLQYFDKDSIY